MLLFRCQLQSDIQVVYDVIAPTVLSLSLSLSIYLFFFLFFFFCFVLFYYLFSFFRIENKRIKRKSGYNTTTEPVQEKSITPKRASSRKEQLQRESVQEKSITPWVIYISLLLPPLLLLFCSCKTARSSSVGTHCKYKRKDLNDDSVLFRCWLHWASRVSWGPNVD